ncbi:MAG: hypothetical protein NC095_00735 [Muribaculum sp.]|nr:hypothetical protein [Muribaculum sp.]
MKYIPFLTFAFASMLSLSSFAAEIGFSYNSSDADPYGYGYSKPQVYDIGIALDSESLIGSKIVSFSVPVFSSPYVSDVKVWLSRELTTSKLDSKFTADIATYDVSLTDGEINFTFPTPYEIPEGGIYLGYSFNISGFPEGSSPAPVAVVDGNTTGGLWLHAETSQKRWADFAGRSGIVSAMEVTLDGSFPENSATANVVSEHIYAAKGETSFAKINVCNWGLRGISSVEYQFSVDGQTSSSTYEFETPVPAVFGRTAEFEAEIPAIDKLGEYNYEFKVIKVNGEDCESMSQSSSCPFTVQPFVAVYRPLVEEYTGRSCGWCPRGYVMLEQMNLYYGDQFVAMAYHNYGSDGMTCVSTIPFSASGAPMCSFNRSNSVDPDMIPALWTRAKDNNTPADVKVSLEWADESKTILRANAKVRFINDIPESDYLFSIALVADGLSNDKWGQSNGYGDYEMSPQYESPYWDLFIGKGSPVMGLEYNDVVVYYKEMSGVEGSLPASIVAGIWYDFSYDIPVADVKTTSGNDVVSNFDKTRAVAVVVNGKNGKPLNCASSIYPDGTVPEPMPSVVESLEESSSVTDTLYFDFQGRLVVHPKHGLYIRAERLSDGSLRTSKIRL